MSRFIEIFRPTGEVIRSGNGGVSSQVESYFKSNRPWVGSDLLEFHKAEHSKRNGGPVAYYNLITWEWKTGLRTITTYLYGLNSSGLYFIKKFPTRYL